MPAPPKPKQHHYIPQTYLRSFVDGAGYVSLYDLWENGKLIRTTPGNILKEKDLYTQPVHAEKRFDTGFETLLSQIEGRWPGLLDAVSNRRPLSEEDRVELYEFICMMRVRVKTTLKAVARLLQQLAEEAIGEVDAPISGTTLAAFKAINPALTPKPGGSNVQPSDLIAAGLASVSVDPHRALLAMPSLVLSLSPIIGRKGLLSFIHNRTETPFISSDNPVIYYDGQSSLDPAPYSISPSGDFSFYFPMSPHLAIRFATHSRRNALHQNVYSAKLVGRLNLQVARYADRYLISNSIITQDILSAYPNECPIPRPETSVASTSGEVSFVGYQWGTPIRAMPKWDYEFGEK